MNTEKWFKNKLESFKEDFEFRLEKVILKLTNRISQRMEQKKMSRIKLAELLHVSPPAITKILDGNSNFTLRKLLSLTDALELELKIDFKEKGIVTSPKIGISAESGFAFFKEESGGVAHTTIFSGSTVGIVPDASTPVISLSPSVSPSLSPSLSPSHETERKGLLEVANA